MSLWQRAVSADGENRAAPQSPGDELSHHIKARLKSRRQNGSPDSQKKGLLKNKMTRWICHVPETGLITLFRILSLTSFKGSKSRWLWRILEMVKAASGVHCKKETLWHVTEKIFHWLPKNKGFTLLPDLRAWKYSKYIKRVRRKVIQESNRDNVRFQDTRQKQL